MEYIFISILFGVLVGCVTGIIPGLHPNNIVAIFISVLPILINYFPLYTIVALAISMFVSHSFTSFISSVIFGVPEEETSLSVLPAHKMSLHGKAYDAIFLTVIGGLLSLIFIIILLPIILMILKPIYSVLIRYLPIFLIIFLVYFILIQKNRVYAVLIVILSGILGYLVLNIYFLKSYEKLTAMFSGLFGASFLIISLIRKSKLPKQNTTLSIKKLYFKESFLGTIGAVITTLFPSLSPSQVIVMLQNIFKIKGNKEFLAMIGALTTADIVISMISLFLIGNPRTGLSAFLEYAGFYLNLNILLEYMSIAMISASVSGVMVMLLSKYIISTSNNIDYKKLNITILSVLTFVVYIISGPVGLMIFITSTSLGLLSILSKTNMSLLVSCLMIPTIISFL